MPLCLLCLKVRGKRQLGSGRTLPQVWSSSGAHLEGQKVRYPERAGFARDQVALGWGSSQEGDRSSLVLPRLEGLVTPARSQTPAPCCTDPGFCPWGARQAGRAPGIGSLLLPRLQVHFPAHGSILYPVQPLRGAGWGWSSACPRAAHGLT